MKMKLHTKFFMYLLAAALIVVLVFPFVWMFLTSFKTPAEIQRVPPGFFPDSFGNLSNYREVLARQPFFRFILNSMIISTLSCLVSIAITSMAGYGFSKFSFKGKEIFFFGILCFLIVPFQAVVVPLYQWVTKFHLMDTYIGLALPLLVSAFGVFLMRQGMDTVPDELIEAARIDGCKEFPLFAIIVFPMVKSFVATQAIIKFMWSWNEFLWPLVVSNKATMKVVTVGLQSFTNMYFTEYHLITAATVFSVLPMAIMFAVFQRGIVRAVSMSGLKG
ncbi:carbohydrate ABC transporter permease [Breznakiella homolactica]|uniref:sn-glycerol-3-phosphate transport system permease protein UgpE n=1 Tax=Breznakiella homolactica TaxID=2798577 RepID=A0A7T8B8C4_9SPIR|nr:carbohydrate ABC transporter permease [Breznakiella homolactica]QQO08434.1 carbohydrate ABC transporter permease [Breznakiella homolactica]